MNESTTQDEVDRLDRVRALLEYATQADHWCDSEACCIENPRCHEMHARAALQELETWMEPEHTSFHPLRLQNDPERIYLEQWQEENKRSPGVNSGFTLIEWILTPPETTSGRRAFPAPVTQRDAHVAASVAQWLGTTCGQCFMQSAERKIKEARAIRNQIHPYWASNIPEHPRDIEIAKVVAGQLAGDKRQPQMIRMIAAALAVARKEAVADALRAATV